MTTFNEFQRELRSRGVEEPNAYIFTLIYERMIHMAKEIDDCAKATLALAETIQRVVQLHQVTLDKVEALRTSSLVESEPNT